MLPVEEARQMRLEVFGIRKFSIQIVSILFELNFDSNSFEYHYSNRNIFRFEYSLVFAGIQIEI